MTTISSPFAIVDFPEDAGEPPHRLRFEQPVTIWRATSRGEVVGVLDAVDAAARTGAWVVGFVAYEAAPAFDPAFAAIEDGPLPLAWFAAFDAPVRLDPPPCDAAAPDDDTGRTDGLVAETALGAPSYAAAIARIHAHIAAGDVYQVNYTVPFTARASAATSALYDRMRRAQGGAYACHLHTGDAEILSASPELFFERRGARVRSRPMKGTASRGLHPAADAAARERLLASEKERAENVMIVDVVRNDLGRIARTGTVRVVALCEAERYPSVWQLTSTVEAEVDPDVPLARLFRALFPPASVTGAPKVSATAIIRELEGAPRGAYCGAIGVVRPGGDATFNVAIRTAWRAAESGELHLNAGGGVTIDSTSRGELEEVGAKLRAFTHATAVPGLFETIRVERGIPIRLERHLHRLEDSARYFGIPFDRGRVLATLSTAIDGVAIAPIARARLDLSRCGEPSATVQPFAFVPDGEPMPVAVGMTPVDASDVRLYHKGTDRALYDAALAAAPDAFDVLLWNDDGEATELTRGNLVVEADGERLTPALECGLLAGTLRAELLERGEIRERRLTLDDVQRADRLWFINSLRGWVPIRLR